MISLGLVLFLFGVFLSAGKIVKSPQAGIAFIIFMGVFSYYGGGMIQRTPDQSRLEHDWTQILCRQRQRIGASYNQNPGYFPLGCEEFLP